MAEKHTEAGNNGVGNVAVADTENEVSSTRRTSKRSPSSSPGAAAPLHKSPRTEYPSSSSQTSESEGHLETGQQDTETRNLDGPSSPAVSPSTRTKSWRRATLTRRSLPALQNQYHGLCRNINPSLPQQERFQKLIEASFKLAIERMQSSLQSVPNISMETFQKQVEEMQKECTRLAANTCIESSAHPNSASAASDPAVQGAMEKFQEVIKRLQAESDSWESLLNKHKRKAEELEKEVVQGQEKGLLLDSTSVTRSSQYSLIQSKPDYHGLLCRQQPMLHTMTLIMDTQCKMVRELLSIKNQSQLIVKETSGRLAAEAGFQNLSPNVVKNLMTAPLSSNTT